MEIDPAITNALNRLLGLPLWVIGRAGDLEWFQFGNQRSVPAFWGGTKVVGEFALHLNCPWRLVSAAGSALASNEATLDVLAAAASRPLDCCGVLVESPARFTLEFSTGEKLLVEAVDHDQGEYWRLFRPATQEPHFVVGPAGVESA